MVGSIRYVPVLRGKAAEWSAVSDLFTFPQRRANTNLLLPLYEIVPATRKLLASSQWKGYDNYFSKIADKIVGHWGDSDPILIDGWHLPETLILNGRHPLQEFFNKALYYQPLLTPVTGLRRSDFYKNAIKQLLKGQIDGLGVRLLLEDVQSPKLTTDLTNLLQNMNVSPEQVDLIIDFQYITTDHPPMAYEDLCYRLPWLNRWRTFTVLGGSFPRDLSDFMAGEQYEIKRREWLQWEAQALNLGWLRTPNFGDYTIQHPLYTEPPENGIPSASIRYTAQKHWVIMRGESLGKEDGLGYAQYPAQAELLSERAEYCGANYCQGDAYLKEHAQDYEKTGSPRSWLRMGVNHHITLVLDQLSNLLVPLYTDAPEF